MGVVTAVGRAVPRVEGRDKVTGAAPSTPLTSIDARNLAYAVHGAERTVPHGRVHGRTRCEHATEIASRRPGRAARADPAELPAAAPLPREMTYDLPLERRPPLSDLTVQHVGQHMAVVVADTLEDAVYAASLLSA